MRRVMVVAVIGCLVGLVVGSFVTDRIGYFTAPSTPAAFRLLAAITIMTPFTIVGAVVGGTGAILARIERMNPEASVQILRQKQQLPNTIPLPTEDETE